MQLVGSPDKCCKVFGQQLNAQESKYCTERIFNHLCTSQNSTRSLMTTDMLGRIEFLANKISEKIKVEIEN